MVLPDRVQLPGETRTGGVPQKRADKSRHTCPRKRERPHARQILEMIAHKRVAEEIHAEKTEDWKQRDYIVSGGKE